MSLRRRLSTFLLFLSLLGLFVFVFDLTSPEHVEQWSTLLFAVAAFSLGVLLRLGSEPAPPPAPKPAASKATPAPKAAPAPKKLGPFAGLLRPKPKPAPPAPSPAAAGKAGAKPQKKK